MHRPTVFALFLAVSLAGCARENPLFCEKEADCAAGLICNVAANECVDPNADDGGPDVCTTADECPAGAPVCSADSVCTACTDGEAGDAVCAMRGDGLPRCAGGACVACIDDIDCAASAPICDDNACRPCERHDECSSLVCDAGTCADERTILYVDADAPSDSPICGLRAEPCQTISGAAGALAKAGIDPARKFIRLLPADSDYFERIIVSELEVTIVGPEVTLQPISVSQDALVLVQDGGQLTLDGVTLAGLPGLPDEIQEVIQCEQQGRLALRDVTIADNGTNTAVKGISAQDCDVVVADATISGQTGIGIDVSGNRLEVVRSLILRNRGGGIRIRDGAAFRLVNNVIAENGFNGSGFSQFGGIEIESAVDPGEQVLAHNTIVDNEAIDSAAASGVSCAVVADTVTAVNNIVYFGGGAGGRSVSGACAWESSVIENPGDVDGSNIITDDPLLSERGLGDFTLQPESPCIDQGEVVDGVTVDRLGVARDDKPDIGAHEFVAP